jgi:outer membrane assembly lipoprotein YfiO
MLLLFIFILLSGCVSEHALVQEEAYFNYSDDLLIEQAQSAIAQKDYRSATKILETFGTLYPLSTQSALVEKLLIELYHRQAEYPMLKAASDRFIYEHPQDHDVHYIKFLRFLSSCKQAEGYPYDWVPFDYAKRDISKFKDCFFEGKSFLIEHPQSPYASQIAHRLPMLKTVIARYYWLRGEDLYSRQQYIGALEAYQTVLQNFPDTEYNLMVENKMIEFELLFPKESTIPETVN